MMQLEWIDDFIALEETRNFTKAARRRNTTQPAFSRRIQRMEEWFGVVLFDRQKRPLALSDAGYAIAQNCRKMRGDMMDMRRLAGAAATRLPDAIKIYTTNSLAIGFLPEYLEQESIKRFSLVVASVSACLAAVNEGRCDQAIIPAFNKDMILRNGFVTEDIGADCLTLCATEAVVEEIALIEPYIIGPILTYSPGTAYAAHIADRLNQSNIKLSGEPRCESPSAEALLAQARMGRGAAWIPHSMIVKSDKLCPLFNRELDCPYDIVAIRKRA